MAFPVIKMEQMNPDILEDSTDLMKCKVKLLPSHKKRWPEVTLVCGPVSGGQVLDPSLFFHRIDSALLKQPRVRLLCVIHFRSAHHGGFKVTNIDWFYGLLF